MPELTVEQVKILLADYILDLRAAQLERDQLAKQVAELQSKVANLTEKQKPKDLRSVK